MPGAGEAVQPETRYARLDGDRIAYQVLGSGPPDLVLARRSYSHIDIAWEDPRDHPVPASPGIVLPTDPVRPARHRTLGLPPA